MTSVARGSRSSHRSGILFVDPSMEYMVYRENLRLHVHERSEVIHEWYSGHGWSSVPWETDNHRNQTSTENRYFIHGWVVTSTSSYASERKCSDVEIFLLGESYLIVPSHAS